MKKTRLHASVLGTLLLIGSAHAQYPMPLAQEEAIDFIKGSSYQVDNPKWSARFTFHSNGVVKASGQRGTDSGSYKIDDGRLCIRWMGRKNDLCGQLVRRPDGRIAHVLDDGRVWMVFRE